MKTFTYSMALALLVSAPALAGDLVTPVIEQPVMMAEQPSVQTWAGGYIGGNISYGFGSLDANDDLASTLATNGFSDNLSEPDGVSGALRAGYDWQFGRGVFGLGAEYNFGSYDGDGEGVLAGSGVNVEIQDMATIFARGGYLVKDNFLAYGLLGYSQAEGEVSLGGTKESEDLDGVTIGFGGEYMFTQNWTGYAEYSYTDFGDVDNTDGQLEADLQQIKFGVNYRF
ncbi:outer membrane immunogenic protein [Sulfitobacter litoralis]|uniref:Outer membrane immunogenic protein n=1 Tax=Sulfitobacter litoralis TaxID=335975 RepID=A0ABY0SV59_9RHOB|nr:outer membrane beta-barrel protein [Sulfitobacter litoralis]SDP63906.1 outer membrane immunogenic protein [Sulfitobacter litoralis]